MQPRKPIGLRKQMVVIPFGKGLADNIAPEVLPPPSIAVAHNVSFRKDGSVERRVAERSQVVSGGPAAATYPKTRALFSHDTKLGLLTLTGFYAHRAYGTTQSWFSGNATCPLPVRITPQKVGSNYDVVSNIDCAVTASYIVVAYNALTDGNDAPLKGPMAVVFDKNFVVIVPPIALGLQPAGLTAAATAGLRVVQVSTTQVAVITTSSGSNTAKLRGRVFTSATRSFGTASAMAAPNNKVWDACGFGGYKTGFLFVTGTPGADQITVKHYGTSFTTIASKSLEIIDSGVSGVDGVAIVVAGSGSGTSGKKAYIAASTVHVGNGPKNVGVSRLTITGLSADTSFTHVSVFGTTASTVNAGYTAIKRLVIGENIAGTSLLVGGTFAYTVSGLTHVYSHFRETSTALVAGKQSFVPHHSLNTTPAHATALGSTVFGLEYVAPYLKSTAANNHQRTAFLCKLTANPESGTYTRMGLPAYGNKALPANGNGYCSWIPTPIAKYNNDLASGMDFQIVTAPKIITLTLSPTGGQQLLFGSLILRRLKTLGGLHSGKADSMDYTNTAPPTGFYSNLGGMLHKVDLGKWPLPQSETSGATHFPLGIPATFDGHYLTEMSTNYYPEIMQVNTHATSSGLSFNFRVVWEWLDSSGKVHRTVPSYVESITGANSKNTHVICIDQTKLLGATQKVYGNKAVPSLYRTVDGQTGLYYSCYGTGPGAVVPSYSAQESGGGMVELHPSVTTLNSTPIFTEGGELPPYPPPAFIDIIASRNRLWGINAEAPTEIWYSKLLSASLAPEWHGLLSAAADDSQEGFVKLAAFDDKIVGFRRSGISYLYGEGPDNKGTGNSLMGPIDIPNSVGCVAPGSVAFGEFGAIFQSQAGAYLLRPDLSLEYVGQPVRDLLRRGTDGATVTVIASGVNRERREVLWFLSKPQTSRESAVTITAEWLVWNFENNTWATGNSRGTGATVTTINYTVFKDLGHRLDSAGGLAKEIGALATTVTTLANTTPTGINSIVETGWIHPGQVNGFARCYGITLLAHNYSSGLAGSTGGVVRARAYFNGSMTYVETYTLSPTDTMPKELRFSFVPGVRKFESIKLLIDDMSCGNTNKGGIRLYAVTMELGIRDGKFPYFNSNQRK